MEFVSPAIALALVVLGLFQGDPVSAVMGAGLLAYVWFTRHMKYEIWLDQLVIYYGNPRRRSVPLADIDGVRPVRSSMGGQGLIITRKGGGALVLKPRDPAAFTAALEGARGVSLSRHVDAPVDTPADTPKRKPSRSRPRKTGSGEQ